MNDAHDDRARGFAAFPPRKGGRARGQSWWGKAWTESMEESWPEEGPLKRGRTFARSGRLGPLTVGPGRIATQVYDSGPGSDGYDSYHDEPDSDDHHNADASDGGSGPWTVSLELPELDDDQWDALWERAADRPAEAEALLGGQLPPDLLEAAEDARLGLLPGYGELDPDCACDEPDHPCAHAVALGYQFSWLLDAEPALLLLVRGREWSGALEGLKSVLLVRAMSDATDHADHGDGSDAENAEGAEDERATAADDGAGSTGGRGEDGGDTGSTEPRPATRRDAGRTGKGSDAAKGSGKGGKRGKRGTRGGHPAVGRVPGPAEGTPFAEAYARPVPPLPALPPLPAAPERSAEAVTGIEADPLERLVADAAVQARDLLGYVLGLVGEPPRPLDVWQDTVRIAATHPDPRVPRRLRESSDRPEELDRAAEAWRFGGSAGLDVLEQAWEPPSPEVVRARTALATGWEDEELPELVVRDNRWTLPGRGLQLRYGRDGRWYPYQERSGTWWPAGAPAHDPALALAELLDG